MQPLSFARDRLLLEDILPVTQSRLRGIWLADYKYRVFNPLNGRSRDIYVMATPEEYRDSWFMRELVEWQLESIEPELLGPEPGRPPAMDSQAFRLGLGHTMRDIKASKRRFRQTGHGRYWTGLGRRK